MEKIRIPVQKDNSVIVLDALPQDWARVTQVLESEMRLIKTFNEVETFYQVSNSLAAFINDHLAMVRCCNSILQ